MVVYERGIETINFTEDEAKQLKDWISEMKEPDEYYMMEEISERRHVYDEREANSPRMPGPLIVVVKANEGDRPQISMPSIDECPIHPEIALANDFCERCGVSWEGVSEDKRIRMRIATSSGFWKMDPSSIIEFVEHIRPENDVPHKLYNLTMDEKYTELKKTGRLPCLRRFSSTIHGKSDV